MKEFLRGLGVFGVYVAITVAMTWPLAASLSTTYADVGVGDPILNARFVHNTVEWAHGNRDGLFDADFFFPHPDAFITTDPAFGASILALPAMPFTSNRLAMVQFAILMTFPLAALGMYLLVRRITGSAAAGFISGTAFAFCFYRLTQLDHVNNLHMQWFPFILFFIHRLKDSPDWKNTAGLAIFFFLNSMGSSNIALYTAPLILATGIWGFVKAGSARWRYLAVGGAAVAITCVALIPFYKPFLAAQEIYGKSLQRGWGEAQEFSARIEQFISAPSWSVLYGKTLSKYMDLGHESAAFIGVTVLLLCLYAFIPAGSSRALPKVEKGLPEARFFIVVGAAYALFSLGPKIMLFKEELCSGPWNWLLDLPGLGAIRTPSRFFMVTEFSAALAAGVGAGRLFSAIRDRGTKVALSVAIPALILLEAWVAPIPLRRIESPSEIPAVYRWLAEQPGHGAVVEFPFMGPLARHRMYYSIAHNRRTVDAISSFFPPVMTWLSEANFNGEIVAPALNKLAAAGLEYAVVHTDLMDASTAGVYRDGLESGGGKSVAKFGGDEVFWFERPEKVMPFVFENVSAQIKPPSSAWYGAPFSVYVRFTSATGMPVYSPGLFRFFLETTIVNPAVAGDTGIRKASSIHLAPPIIAGEDPLEVRVRVEIVLPTGEYDVKYRLIDEHGRQWAEGAQALEIRGE